MGIDIYMRWGGQTEEEKSKQLKGFDTTIGDAGYLREAYHGDPYATKVLVPEAFEQEAEIPVSLLKERLPETIKAAIERNEKIYKKKTDENSPEVKAYKDFVSLAEMKEKELGKPVRIYASY